MFQLNVACSTYHMLQMLLRVSQASGGRRRTRTTHRSLKTTKLTVMEGGKHKENMSLHLKWKIEQAQSQGFKRTVHVTMFPSLGEQ